MAQSVISGHGDQRKRQHAALLVPAMLMAMLVALLPALTAAGAQTRPPAPRATMPAPPEDNRPVPNETRPLPEIVARVQATPPYNTMDYIGVESFQVRQRIYVLRFIDGRQVVAVHVDARSGRILGRSP